MLGEYKIFEIDPYLKPYKEDIHFRMDSLSSLTDKITQKGSLLDFANAYNFYGFHKIKNKYIYREWAPKAKALFLIGDFNNWDRFSHPLRKIDDENWEIVIDDNLANTNVKVRVVGENGSDLDRIPLYINHCTRDEFFNLTGNVFESTYKFKHKNPQRKNSPPFIYECHIGMATEKEGIGTYDEFRQNVLPKIAEDGFDTLQIMGIMEHPYYGSFGYQVSNFFAPCSLFGTPDELRHLIDDAHGLGIFVLLDIVHSHAVSNVNEGINLFDGSCDQFFLGDHPAWGSKVFDYSKEGVLKFLLSNVAYYMKELNFDGFRFDGVTSMLYNHYGLGVSFDNYDKYFSLDVNMDAVNYLQLATTVMKEINPHSIAICEDMSGMPGMCLPVYDGGLGFDFRLAMGTADMWIKLIKDEKDENWDMNKIYYELATKRPSEKSISYAESHDQALVGDKTIIFRLCDKEMYWHMSKDDDNPTITRGISLYKVIYGLTMSLGSDGYLNFMGNEFGHPEWIDFPREGNGFSYKYARRQFSLKEDQNLKYGELHSFNSDLISLIKQFDALNFADQQLYIDQDRKIICFRRNNLLFTANFHFEYSEPDMFIPLHSSEKATLIFSSDKKQYGGFERLIDEEEHLSINRNGFDGVSLYVPNRTFNVYELR